METKTKVKKIMHILCSAEKGVEQIIYKIEKDEWEKQRSDINESLLKEYQKEIKHDINEIISCNIFQILQDWG